MATTAAWACELKGVDSAGGATVVPESITVGTKLLLSCEGEPVTFKNPDAVGFQLPKNQQYVLRILETKSLKETSGEFIVTSWKVGEHKVAAIITDGENAATIPPLEFTVTSSIDAESNPEGKPYAPLGPLTLGFPSWFWIMLGAVAAMAAGCLVMAIFTYVQRKRFLSELAHHQPALTPFNQFNKELRKLLKG
ncbi:MAG: hypothetical protein V4692_02690, partial [Bdellovibrionota bacterium]